MAFDHANPTESQEFENTLVDGLDRARKNIVIVLLSTSTPEIEFLNVALTSGSVGWCKHIRSIDRARLLTRIGSISPKDIPKTEEGIARIIGMNR